MRAAVTQAVGTMRGRRRAGAGRAGARRGARRLDVGRHLRLGLPLLRRAPDRRGGRRRRPSPRSRATRWRAPSPRSGPAAATELEAGGTVALWPLTACGDCYPCRVGRPNICDELQPDRHPRGRRPAGAAARCRRTRCSRPARRPGGGRHGRAGVDRRAGGAPGADRAGREDGDPRRRARSASRSACSRASAGREVLVVDPQESRLRAERARWGPRRSSGPPRGGGEGRARVVGRRGAAGGDRRDRRAGRRARDGGHGRLRGPGRAGRDVGRRGAAAGGQLHREGARHARRRAAAGAASSARRWPRSSATRDTLRRLISHEFSLEEAPGRDRLRDGESLDVMKVVIRGA